MHPYMYCSINYNCQDLQSTQVLYNREVEKEVVHICNVILINHKKECNLVICDNVHGPREYYAVWKKSEMDKYHMISLTYGT